MEHLTITRMMANTPYSIRLTNQELEQAYQIRHKHYLKEDFCKALTNLPKNPSCRFRIAHLEEFPELVSWLCEHYEHFNDANMAPNDLIRLTLNHLYRSSLTAGFFTRLAQITPAICCGTEKNVEHCERECAKYYRCDNIASADERSKQWELLASLISMHNSGICSCKSTNSKPCIAHKYLSGTLDISDFFRTNKFDK
jgi:hypothetical protein